jgi:hypothetical protein
MLCWRRCCASTRTDAEVAVPFKFSLLVNGRIIEKVAKLDVGADGVPPTGSSRSIFKRSLINRLQRWRLLAAAGRNGMLAALGQRRDGRGHGAPQLKRRAASRGGGECCGSIGSAVQCVHASLHFGAPCDRTVHTFCRRTSSARAPRVRRAPEADWCDAAVA